MDSPRTFDAEEASPSMSAFEFVGSVGAVLTPAEWEEYHRQISAWELDRFLTLL